MTAKEYLRKYTNAKDELETKINRIASLEELIQKCTLAYGGERVKSSLNTDAYQDRLCALVDLKNKFKAQAETLTADMAEVIGVVQECCKGNLYRVIDLHYFSGLKWEEIAENINYSIRSTHNLHSHALQKISKHLQTLH